MNKENSSFLSTSAFSIHLFFLLLAWVGPFLITWKLMLPAFLIVVLQFLIFKKCLMNETHGLEEGEDHTFYAELLEKMGFNFNRKKLKRFVRGYLYILLGIVTYVWQVILGNAPLLF